MSLKIKDSLPKMYQHHQTGLDSHLNLDQVAAELGLLSKELTISVDILRKIRDSVLVLELSVQVQE